MGGSRRIGVALLVVLAAGCGWLQSGYDAGKNNANPFENHVTLANVATLEDRTLPAPDPTHAIRTFITAQGWIFLLDGVNVYAYDVATCPTANGTPCHTVWQAPAAGATSLASDGVRLFVSTGVGIDVRALGGTLLGHLPYGGASITIADGFVWTTQTVVTQHSFPPRTEYTIEHDLKRFPVGCDPKACPQEALGTWDGPAILTSLSDLDSAGSSVAVFDGRPYHARIRDGRAVTTQGLYDLSNPACQSPTPGCTASGSDASLSDVAAVSPSHVFGFRVQSGDPPATDLQWLPGVHTACPGTPATCAPAARASLGAYYGSTSAAVGGDVVYVGTPTGLTAYAEDGSTNCTRATPRVCSPLAQFAVGAVREIQVVDRRVYASTNVALHILRIPGDVR